MSKTAIIGLTIAAVLVAGGGALLLAQRNSSTNMDMPADTNSNTSSDSSKATATDAVTIQDFAFGPASVTVKKGATVTWTNQDSAAHTVTQDTSTPGGPGMDSKNLSNGETYSATFNTAGTFKYHCALHPNMTGSVTVTE